MSRPRKCRKVCHFPKALVFGPQDNIGTDMIVSLTVDEYETVRLIDKDGLSQEQCAKSMHVARTTVQQIYSSARKKLADFLGVDETVIADWEAGKSEPTVTQGMMLGNLYGMPMEELFGEVDVYDAVPEDVQGEFEHHAWLNRVANYS